MILPLGKISNMARTSHVSGPRFVCLHHRIVQPNWEQHGSPFLLLAFERRFDFRLDPRAGNGSFRKNNQQFVVRPDRFVDFRPKPFPDFQILRSKPATDAHGLQIGMEAFSKLLIFA
jgi:hypothetical protein